MSRLCVGVLQSATRKPINEDHELSSRDCGAGRNSSYVEEDCRSAIGAERSSLCRCVICLTVCASGVYRSAVSGVVTKTDVYSNNQDRIDHNCRLRSKRHKCQPPMFYVHSFRLHLTQIGYKNKKFVDKD